jgi:hypothetical protein
MRLPTPPDCELQVLVRQVEPGKRVRVGFHRLLEMPIPDDENFIHALFDLVSENRAATAKDLLERVLMYASQKASQT